MWNSVLEITFGGTETSRVTRILTTFSNFIGLWLASSVNTALNTSLKVPKQHNCFILESRSFIFSGRRSRSLNCQKMHLAVPFLKLAAVTAGMNLSRTKSACLNSEL